MAFFFLNGCTRFVFGILWAFHELDENLLEFIGNAIEVRSRPWKRHWNGELSGLLPSFYRVSLWSTESWPVLLGFYRVSRAAKVFHCDYFGDGKKIVHIKWVFTGFWTKKKTKNKNALPSFTEFRGQSKDERWMQRGQIKVSLGPNFTGFYRVLRIHQESVYRVWPNFEMEGAPKKNELKKNGSSHRVFTGFLPGFYRVFPRFLDNRNEMEWKNAKRCDTH